jgi:hypothetical protein
MIKQQGGIFGRNPTFNEVTIDGDLSLTTLTLGGVGVTASADELNYVDGVTSSIQTQINTKANSNYAQFTGNINVAGPIYAANSVNIEHSSGYATLEMGGLNGAFIDLKSPFSDDYDTRMFWDGTNFSIGTLTGDQFWTIGGSEKLRILSSGGITFNGDTAAANALDDYEEGTWTPVLNGSTTNPTYTTSAYYTKIGNIVTVTGKLTFTTSGSGNYIITIASLPFSPSPDSPTGTMSVLDSGTAWYSGTVRGDAVNLISYIGTTIFSSTAPFTVASGDSLNCTITYRTS